MSTFYEDVGLQRLARTTQGQRFSWANAAGMQYYSGADVRVYFDHIHVSEIDSIGFQQAQNVRPIYGYHSYTYDALQYGTKLVQGYLQMHFTESGYLPSVLAAVEAGRRARGTRADATRAYTAAPEEQNVGVVYGQDLWQGDTIEAVVGRLSGSHHAWRRLMDDLDAKRFGRSLGDSPAAEYLNIPGLFPPKPLDNDFSFNPRNSHLRATGFTITVAYGDAEVATVNGELSVTGTFRQLHEVHIVAGPNTQIEADGKPVAELYTFISRGIS